MNTDSLKSTVRRAKRRLFVGWRQNLICEDISVVPRWDRPISVSEDRYVILSCYFSRVADAQAGANIAADNFALLERWARGIEENNLHAVIFHDNLSDEFCQNVSKQFANHLSFAKCNSPRIMSNTDFRFVYTLIGFWKTLAVPFLW